MAVTPPTSTSNIRAPSLPLLLLELRVLAELPLFLARTLSTAGLPRGDGHAVLVVPGFGADDLTTLPLRSALRRLGYATCGWGLGRNLGMRPGIKQALANQLTRLHGRHGGPVSLIGWSLGGVFVREMARHQPELVRDVYTLGSPINGNPDANNMRTLFRLANRGRAVKTDLEAFNRRRQPPPVPCTALYSRRDGIVAWRCCLEDPAPNTRNVEVGGSHFGLVFNPRALHVVAQSLATPPIHAT